jgi:hypothetical protein
MTPVRTLITFLQLQQHQSNPKHQLHAGCMPAGLKTVK